MRIAVLTAVRPETRAALRGLSGIRRVRGGSGPAWQGRAGTADVCLLQSGVGLACAAAATARLLPPPDLLVSVGFAGALRRRVDVGTLVVSERLLWEDAAGRSAYEVPSWLVRSLRGVADGATIEGPLLSSPAVLGTTAAKAAAGERYGAAAVEMEGAALARYAVRHGVPFLPVRAVLDPMELSLAELPQEIGTSWTARARLVLAPGLWPTLRVLREHAVRASDVLARITARLLPALGQSA